MKVFATSLLVVILGATLSSACTEGDTAPIDGKCREYQVCKNGTWEKESCNTPMRKYSKEQKKCLWWFQVDCSEERQCNNEEAILKNPYTCSSYYKCKNGKLEANNCWWPFFYDGETGCKFWGNCHSSEVVGGNTDKTELYADPCENDESEPIANHCFWYKTCGTDGFFKQTRCSLGKYFDAANKTCDWFWSVSCDVSTCDGKPRADPGSDGKFYYQCIDGFLMKKSCGPLRKFDATQEKCVFDFQAMTPNVSKLISESPKQSLLVSTVNDKPVETNLKVVESLQTKQNRSNVSIKRVVRSIMLANCNNGERTFDKDCYKFRECDQGVWVTKECPPGMLYSKTECRWIGDAVCDEGACIAGQSTAYPTDCTLYYKCNPATHDKEVEDCGRVIWKRHYNPQTHQCYLPGFWDTACPATAAS